MEKKIDYKEFEFGDKPERDVCSSGDCTGAVPVPPQTRAEKESYKNVYDYEPIPFTKESDK